MGRLHKLLHGLSQKHDTPILFIKHKHTNKYMHIYNTIEQGHWNLVDNTLIAGTISLICLSIKKILKETNWYSQCFQAGSLIQWMTQCQVYTNILVCLWVTTVLHSFGNVNMKLLQVKGSENCEPTSRFLVP